MSQPVHYHQGQFPPTTLDWAALIPHIGPAAAAVARYDGMLAAIPNADVLLGPLTTQEAVLSSKIEGTQATMGEVLEFEADASPPDLPEARRDDIQEVLNYRRAMRKAEEMLAKLPLSLRVVREAHQVLLDGVRGQGKSPGLFRRGPNWIGPPGCSLEEAKKEGFLTLTGSQQMMLPLTKTPLVSGNARGLAFVQHETGFHHSADATQQTPQNQHMTDTCHRSGDLL